MTRLAKLICYWLQSGDRSIPTLGKYLHDLRIIVQYPIENDLITIDISTIKYTLQKKKRRTNYGIQKVTTNINSN